MQPRTFLKHQSIRRTGAAAIEFALVATLFFTVLLSIFEFGWLNVIRHTADNAAYEAARAGIVPGATAANVRAEAQRLLANVGARGATITITPAQINSNTDEVQVEIVIPASANGIIAAKFFRNVNFRSQSRLLTERVRR